LATYHAIAVISQAILGMLAEAAPKPEFAGAQFELYLARDFQNPMEEGVSLYLYRVGTSSRRNLPSRIGPQGERYRPPLPIDLYYLLTTWARTSAKQQRLLGWCIRELGNTPILPAGLLNHYSPEPETFRPQESVEFVFEPLSLQDIASLWEPLKPHLQVSASYVARMVTIESDVTLPDAAAVQTREFDFAKAGA
jgi:Pvc16 N-terminal domain